VRFLTMLGIALALLLGPGAVAFLFVRYIGLSQSLAIRSLGLLAFVALVAVVVIIARRGEHLPWSEVGFGRVSWASVGWAVALICFLAFAFGPLASALLDRNGVGSLRTGTVLLKELPLWYLILTIVLVAAGEEWLYRGYAISLEDGSRKRICRLRLRFPARDHPLREGLTSRDARRNKTRQ
jgi:membrane protease YdiL (CAAX protease family)